MPETLEATYRIVTPMFIGGADQSPSDGIRPPSVKGALRFWWRALNWSRLREQKGNDPDALKQLHEDEVRYFGASAEQGGQGSFLLSISQIEQKFIAKGSIHPEFKSLDAARYLGYGLMEAFFSRNKGTEAGQLTRGCINEKQHFTVSIISRQKIDETIHEALIALGLFGGLGSRSRHGMGSLSLESLSLNGNLFWQLPADKGAFIESASGLLNGKRTSVLPPPYSAFSQNARVDVLLEAGSPFAILDEFARAQLMYRSWGRKGWVLGERSEKKFRADHDWRKGVRPKNFHPKRVVFGLPHNYEKWASMQVTPEKQNRRASPLLFHVQALGDGSYIGVSILLKSAFLPLGEKINAGGTVAPAKIEWDILSEFLDGKNRVGQLRFPKRTTI